MLIDNILNSINSIKLKPLKNNMKIYPTEYLGTEYSGWSFCPVGINKDNIIYSFGVGEEISWEEKLIEKYNVQIYGFDPTPRSIDFVKEKSLTNFYFYPIGVADFDGFVNFYPPKNPKHVSHSMIIKQGDSKPIKVKMQRLDSIMKSQGHNKIDILKLDIEGAEYSVIDHMINNKIFPSQILVEFHHRFKPFTTEDTIKTINNLTDCSYDIFSISPSYQEFSFILNE
ncbi:MAG: FkbM family methyltransferase [Methanosarcina sp.]|nr:FkbM family methyltransferase [Methanosarcina sp.]MDD3874806.1 FkbM family methyltransferase [Methanosarcina sp.]MDD4521497.1 FkbM family methyltransferase [Methanosarcina sp.]